ncbi:MAG: imidazole glycerol phosphate synthase subunit HisF [Nitrospina sp.]|jgi:imidazole glycerol-phosphate synthase subunit HisF|nr:imidazole glycerol phosphate synthase subunit HisF [Nitrospina sp.]
MLNSRVIPCLLLQNGGLVKTLKFAKPKYVGDPINAIRIFNDKEVDELIVLDISASKEKRDPDYALIEKFAGECFMPLCYGGGVNSVRQARQLFALGVEKVCLQTAALEDPSIITRISDNFGRQSVVVSVDIKKSWMGEYKLYRSIDGKKVKQPWLLYLQHVANAGAGEIVVNSVDLDGTMAGMNLELIREAASAIKIPLIAMGGAGSLSDMRDAIQVGASAVSAGAFFVFHGPHRAVLITYPDYRELEKLLGKK